MVDMHMGQHQCLYTGNIEINSQIVGTRTAWPLIPALKEATVNQYRSLLTKHPFVGRPRHTRNRTMMQHIRKRPIRA